MMIYDEIKKSFMKRASRIAFLCVAILTAAAFSAPEKCSGIEEGSKAYSANDFERAIDEWNTCVENGIMDADLHYNLGNAYFRSGKLGFSIFHYKKALRLRANDDDIVHNLKYAEAMTRDKVSEDETENPILMALYKTHHALPLKTQLVVLLGLFWLMAIISVVRRIAVTERSKNICIGGIFAITAIFCIVGISAAYKVIVLETDITGVVTNVDADVTSEPSEKSQTLNTLSEGTSFEVISEQGNYAEIRLGEKIKGFVKLSDVGIVK